MAIVKKIDGVTGDMAIYTSGDDNPFTDPTNYLSRLRFHSDLLYPVIATTFSGTLNLAAIANPNSGFFGSVQTLDTNVGAHGQAGPPMVFGDIVVGGQRVSICGLVPVTNIFDGTIYETTQYTGWGRYLSLIVDSTNVYIRATTLLPTTDVPGASTVEAFSGAYNIYVTSLDLNNPDPTPSPTAYTFNETPSYVEYGRGKFRSDRRFIRASASVSDIKFALGATYGWNVEYYSGPTRPGQWAFTWNIGSQSRQMMTGYAGGSLGTINGPAFTASVQDATT
jgi:hypothetical protein